MKLVYFGTSEFAVPSLRALAPHICMVVSQPDRPSGRGMKLKPSPVKQVALELGLPVQTPEKARDLEFVDFIKGLNADALIVAAYGQILSVKLLESAKQGGINLHGSILPKYRGAAPIQRAIFEGESVTGVTLMQMAKGMDTGDIIDTVITKIGEDETYGELQDRLAEMAAIQIAEWVGKIVTGAYPRLVQDDSQATHAAKIERSETELSFDSPADTEYRRFRAFTPNPSCFVETAFGRLKLNSMKRSQLVESQGVIAKLDPLTIGFRNGCLEFHLVQPEGKPRQRGTDWANGQRLSVGDSVVAS